MLENNYCGVYCEKSSYDQNMYFILSLIVFFYKNIRSKIQMDWTSLSFSINCGK